MPRFLPDFRLVFHNPVTGGDFSLELYGVGHTYCREKSAQVEGQLFFAFCFPVVKPYNGIAQGNAVLVKAYAGGTDSRYSYRNNVLPAVLGL